MNTFCSLNADRFLENNRRIGNVTATTGGTDYLISIDLHDDTVKGILDAYREGLKTHIYVYDNHLSVHMDPCFATNKCIEEQFKDLRVLRSIRPL